MKTIQVKAVKRENYGKKAAKAVRREGQIPAVLYGGGVHGVGLGIVGDSLGSSGSGDHGHIVIGALSGDSQRRGGGNIAHQSGDALIHHLGKAGDSLRSIALLVHGDDLQLLAVDTAIGIDLLHVQACAVDNSQTVNGSIAGHGAQNTHLDGAAGSSSGTGGRTGSRRSSRACGRTAAGSQSACCGNNTGSGHELTTSDHLFHKNLLLRSVL